MSAGDAASSAGEDIVAVIEDVFLRRGADSYLGEAVTMAEHMLQTARLAEEEEAGDDLIAAALLHDVGHYLSEFAPDAAEDGIDNLHEEAGAVVLARHFPPVVVEAVRGHVAAKRYLCAVDPAYRAQLSDASIQSLALQGGPMSADEVASMRENPHLDAILQVRRWDDRAKVMGRETPPFAHYAPLLRRVAARAN